MRDIEYAKQEYHELHEKKPMSANKLFVLYASAVMLFFFALLTRNGFIIFVFFTVFSVVTNYHTNMQTIRIDEGSEFFMSLLLTRAFGLPYGVGLIVLSGIIIDIITGRMDENEVVSSIFSVIANVALSFFPSASFVVVAAIIVVVKYVLELLLDFFLGESADEILCETVIGFATNLFLVIAFGSFFIGLLAG